MFAYLLVWIIFYMKKLKYQEEIIFFLDYGCWICRDYSYKNVKCKSMNNKSIEFILMQLTWIGNI